MSTLKLVYKLEDLLYLNMKKYKNLFGATDNQIASLENLFELELPADFKEYYKLKDGSLNTDILHLIIHNVSYSSFVLMPLKEIKKTKVYLFDHDKKVDMDYDKYEKFDIRIKPYLSNKKWLPFAHTKSGSLYLMLDYDPSEEGKAGQILCYVCEPRFVYYVGETFSELLEKTISNLERLNKIGYDMKEPRRITGLFT